MNTLRSVKCKSLCLVLFFVFFVSICSYAADSIGEKGAPQGGQGLIAPPPAEQGQAGGKEMKAPPQPAIDACVNKKEGDACTCPTPNGDEAGVCEYSPDKKFLACRPNSVKPPVPPEKPKDPAVK